jgi:hypothetical protein
MLALTQAEESDVNCDFLNNNNSIIIKLETCIVNVLCQMQVKYNIVSVFIVEYDLSNRLKSH